MIPESAQDSTHSTSIDVLFVDDSVNLCRAMELWLISSGYQAMTALSAAQAEEIAREKRPKVVITDIGLPDSSGYELQRRLKEIEGMEHTDYIALAGERDKSNPRHAIEAGFDTFLSKPPSFEELAAILREALPNHPSNAGF